ncbi:MAG: TolC family protein [Ignavibacteria bacterium]
MKAVIILFFAIANLLFYSNELFSQNIRILNLDEAISIAKKNNSELMIVRIEKLKAEEKISEVYSENLVPTITLNSRYTRSFKKQVIEIFGQKFEIGSDNSIINTFDITEPIPVLGTPVFSGIRIAEYYSKIQDENINFVENNVRTNVKKAFFTVLLMKEVIEVNSSSLLNAEENLRVVDVRYKAGVAMEFDYLRAKVKVETLKPNLKQSENNLVLSQKLLKNTLGIRTDEVIDAAGRLTFDSTELIGSSDNIIKKVINENVSVRQLKINKLINDELIRVDRSNFMPKIYLFGQYSLQAFENDGRALTKYRFFNSISAGVGLTWDLNFFRHGYKENQSILESKKTEEQIIDVKEKLKTQSESVLLKIDDAKNRIAAQIETIKQAERGLELANISFKSGVLNQIDVLDAELTLSQVKLGYLQAVYDYLIARTELEQLLEK